MKNNTANNTIKFIDKKAEYSDKSYNKKLRIDKLKSKENVIIEYEKRKKRKNNKNKKQKVTKKKVYKSKKRTLTIFTCILCLFVMFSLWNLFIKPSFINSQNNGIQTESQNLSNSKTSTFSSTINESIKNTLDVKPKITISDVHKNYYPLYTQSYFENIKNKNIHFDVI